MPDHSHSICVKCGAVERGHYDHDLGLMIFRVQYVAASPNGGGDALMRTCYQCGYTWPEACLDSLTLATAHTLPMENQKTEADQGG